MDSFFRSYLDESSNKDVMNVGNILNERENNYYMYKCPAASVGFAV